MSKEIMKASETIMGDNAFSYCEDLADVIIGVGNTEIGTYSFYVVHHLKMYLLQQILKMIVLYLSLRIMLSKVLLCEGCE